MWFPVLQLGSELGWMCVPCNRMEIISAWCRIGHQFCPTGYTACSTTPYNSGYHAEFCLKQAKFTLYSNQMLGLLHSSQNNLASWLMVSLLLRVQCSLGATFLGTDFTRVYQINFCTLCWCHKPQKDYCATHTLLHQRPSNTPMCCAHFDAYCSVIVTEKEGKCDYYE